MERGLAGCDIVMMLRLQTERMQGSYVPSIREYFRYYGLDEDKLQAAKPDALIMHPGPMNRSEEHTSELQSLMRSSYAVSCLKKNKHPTHNFTTNSTNHTIYSTPIYNIPVTN